MPSKLTKTSLDEFLTSSDILDFDSSVQSIISNSSVGEVIWNVVTSDTDLVPGNGYICASESRILLTLPSTANVNSRISIYTVGIGGWKIQQQEGGQIQVGHLFTTYGALGYIESLYVGDYLPLVFANNMWIEIGMRGNINVI
jgi:hypothetical protein